MESFQGHLSCRFTNRLSSNCATGLTRLHNSLLVVFPNQLNELVELLLGQKCEIAQEFLIIELGLQMRHLLANVTQEAFECRHELM